MYIFIYVYNIFKIMFVTVMVMLNRIANWKGN